MRPADSPRTVKLSQIRIMGSTDDPKWLQESCVGQPSAGSSNRSSCNQLPARWVAPELRQSFARSRS